MMGGRGEEPLLLLRHDWDPGEGVTGNDALALLRGGYLEGVTWGGRGRVRGVKGVTET